MRILGVAFRGGYKPPGTTPKQGGTGRGKPRGTKKKGTNNTKRTGKR